MKNCVATFLTCGQLLIIFGIFFLNNIQTLYVWLIIFWSGGF